MKTSHRGFVVPLVLLIIALLIGGGAYVYNQLQSDKAPATSVNESKPPMVPPEGWTNDTAAGMQFSYPSDWQKTTKTADTSTTITFEIPNKDSNDLYGEVFIIKHYPVLSDLTLETWWLETINHGKYSIKKTTLAGFPTYILGLPESDAPPRYIFIVKTKDSRSLIFDITARGETVSKVLMTLQTIK
ncbi:hypothetical protein A2678_02860 [Candidatus Kaiserbacteria bacterium RIFCSPHIGHO2_01_FULL_53_31]|uniref:Uncharacterized protein n=1 Tax=Candidatus Kaiserbacteria bacterium RIFCSPHIGHO2_01_FULL_53_31 TaxID=1798481 RepID=A0A1F6CIU5_9BACT|nr:MAG: hypothetical protein A2678_02860 [Candidatus Kaiserbacteria bacterium RIFCSPHIGHO2_01_FULL_53_31]